ncbi:MAG: hypothetical protein J7K26_04135 [Candidatus Aenigmarchaeota archaeon]|nr:hypothetical protein [Candidatus Aenigmarchaeota archaeon]
MSLAAKTIVYVSQFNECYLSDCECLNGKGEDYYFCKELEDLGYDIKILSGADAAANNSAWVSAYKDADMIFLGNISQDLFSTQMCDYINKSYNVNTGNISIFAALTNVNKTNNIIGCIFHMLNEQITYDSTQENTCSGPFVILQGSSYITYGYSGTVSLYDENGAISIYDTGTTPGFIGVHCEPNGKTIDDYPLLTIYTNETGEHKYAFWGLGTPSNFTSLAWNFFDRTVFMMMGDIQEEITGEVITDKETYKPHDTIEVSFTTDSYVTDVEFELFLGENEIASIPFDETKKDGNTWKLNYSIPGNSLNGTYSIKVLAKSGYVEEEFEKTVDIIPYNIFYTLDKTNYIVGDNIIVNLYIINPYSDEINYTANITIPDIGEIVSDINKTFNYTFIIPEDAYGGKYNLYINLNDSDGRTFVLRKDFLIKTIGALDVIPPEWNIQTPTDGSYEKMFTITNIGQTDLYNISIEAIGDLNILISNNTIDKLEPSDSASFVASVSIDQEGSYNATIVISSEQTAYNIPVSIEYNKEVIKDNLEITPSYLNIISIPGKEIEKIITLTNKGDYDITSLSYNMDDNLLGIISFELPSIISAHSEEETSVVIDTSALQQGTYTGKLNISSSLGYGIVIFNIEIIGDLTIDANQKLSELSLLEEKINNLKKKRKDTSSLEASLASIQNLLNDVISDYNNDLYESAKTKLASANSQIASLEANISSLELQKESKSGIIWIIAFIIIIGIIGFLIYRYKDKIMELISGQKEEYVYSQEEYY